MPSFVAASAFYLSHPDFFQGLSHVIFSNRTIYSVSIIELTEIPVERLKRYTYTS